MKQGRLSSGSASIGQLMLVIFFAPFMLFLCYSVLNKTTNDGLIFLAVVTGVVILIFKNAISYADVSIEGRSLLIEKFFFVRKKSVDEFKLINSAILPFTYYIEFTDGKKVYFFLRYSEIFKQFFGSDSDKFLIDLRKMFNDEKRLLGFPLVLVKTLNIVGLCLDIAGAIVMFLYTPHPINISGIGDGDDIKNELNAAIHQKKRVRVGMTLLITGFLLQLISTILS